jgi:hypothetical protein
MLINIAGAREMARVCSLGLGALLFLVLLEQGLVLGNPIIAPGLLALLVLDRAVEAMTDNSLTKAADLAITAWTPVASAPCRI